MIQQRRHDCWLPQQKEIIILLYACRYTHKRQEYFYYIYAMPLYSHIKQFMTMLIFPRSSVAIVVLIIIVHLYRFVFFTHFTCSCVYQNFYVCWLWIFKIICMVKSIWTMMLWYSCFFPLVKLTQIIDMLRYHRVVSCTQDTMMTHNNILERHDYTCVCVFVCLFYTIF